MIKESKNILIAFLLSLSLSCSLLAKSTEVEYLVPEGFTGGVIILYDQKDGVNPEVKKKERLFTEFLKMAS